MRLKINCYADEIPITYRNQFLSIIKEAVSLGGNGDIFYPEDRHEVGKTMCFSVILPKNKIVTKKQHMLYGTNVVSEVFSFPEENKVQKPISFLISSADIRFIASFMAGIRKVKRKNIKIGAIKIIPDKKFGNETKIYTTSPICINENIEMGEPFNNRINDILQKKYKSCFGTNMTGRIWLEPVAIKQIKVKHAVKDFFETKNKPYLIIPAITGTFIMTGSPEAVAFAYECGIGERTGQGFGMLEVTK